MKGMILGEYENKESVRWQLSHLLKMKMGSTPDPLHYLHVLSFLALCVDLCTTPTECEHCLPNPVSKRTIAKGKKDVA